MPRLTWIDQIDFEASGLQQLEQRDPIDAGRFHGDRLDAALGQPVGQLVEVSGAGAEAADMCGQVDRVAGRGRRGRLRGDGDPVDGGMDVDASGVRIDLVKRLVRWVLAEVFVLAWRHDGLR